MISFLRNAGDSYNMSEQKISYHTPLYLCEADCELQKIKERCLHQR